MLVTDIHTHEVVDTYRQFADAVGDVHWKKCVTRCKQAIKGNDFLRDHLETENDIAYQLCGLGELAERYGAAKLPAEELQPFYPAASFAAQVLSLMAGRSKEDSEKLRRRVHGALRKPSDMRGLRLELSAATHFARRGKRISWPETTGQGTFDLLVEGPGQPPLEVECKSIADNKGRKIPTLEMLEFFDLLKPDIWPFAKGLTGGLSVVLTVPERLPTAHKERVTLAKSLAKAVLSGGGALTDGSTVRISDFDVNQLGDSPNPHPQALRQAVDGVTGTENRQVVLIGTSSGGALALALQSLRDDSLLKAVFDILSDAASRQLTRTRAGMLWVGFDGLDGTQLLSVAEQDQDTALPPTSLRVAVSQFLSSPNREHVVGVGFVSRSALRPVQMGLMESGGIAYYFPKRESSLWSESFSGMFSWTHEGVTP